MPHDAAVLSPAPEQSPHELYDSLNALRLEPAATYQLVSSNRIELRRGGVELYFEEGKLDFFAPSDGHITGFVFSGRGHILAFPRELVEKQQMARFLGTPVLDQEFLSAYVRFTDDAAEDLLRQFHSANLAPQLDTAFATLSDPFLAQFNPSQSLRILEDRLSQNPKPYFYAALEGMESGAFDLLFDPQRKEQVLLGQRRKSGDISYYDVWASYGVPGVVAPQVDFHALDYAIDTTVLPDNSLDATAAVHLRAETSGERIVTFQLSRALHADSVTGAQDKPLAYFQNEGMNRPAAQRPWQRLPPCRSCRSPPRKARSLPFVSTITATSFATLATVFSSLARAKAGIRTSAIKPILLPTNSPCAGRDI